MSCGLPAVVTQNGGPSESMQEGEETYGMLVDPADPNDIANGLVTLLSSGETWQGYHEAGMRRVLERYTWDRTAEGYYEVLEQVSRSPQQSEVAPIPAYFSDPGDTLGVDTLRRLYFGDGQ